MAKIKTRDLILDVALILFNERGEPLVTSVDLAHEMNISPGNLYYHFKGKEEVIEELYARFHAGLSLLMDDIQEVGELDEDGMLMYLGLVADFFLEYKFISQNTAALCARYENLRRPLSKALNKLHLQLQEFVENMLQTPADERPSSVSVMLANNLLNTLLNLQGSLSLLSDEDQTANMREHLYLQLLPFLPE
jgi:AcrR family transcriptional regulator